MNPSFARLLALGAPLALLVACASEPAAPPAPTSAPAPAPTVVTAPPVMNAPPPPARRTGRLSLREAQQALADKGYDPGAVDGHWGPRSTTALRQFQRAQGLVATGRLDAETLDALAR